VSRKAARLFVYGTLIDSSNTPASRWLRSRVRALVRASVPGRLVAIPTPQGWYPALVPASGLRVVGMCCRVRLGPRDLAWLDRYEGREYRRVTARALAGASFETVQLYRWRGAVPPGAREIPGGDFLNWLGRHCLRAYGVPARRSRRVGTGQSGAAIEVPFIARSREGE
jgi:gamma-glutamylcyclotransferase (GGCT)/AIG2-like uncharacterized protein YtfP